MGPSRQTLKYADSNRSHSSSTEVEKRVTPNEMKRIFRFDSLRLLAKSGVSAFSFHSGIHDSCLQPYGTSNPWGIYKLRPSTARSLELLLHFCYFTQSHHDNLCLHHGSSLCLLPGLRLRAVSAKSDACSCACPNVRNLLLSCVKSWADFCARFSAACLLIPASATSLRSRSNSCCAIAALASAVCAFALAACSC